MNTELFRKAALMKLTSPEELDKLLTVTNAKGWLIFTGLTGIVVVFVLWGIFGSIVTTLPASGVLVRQDGIEEVVSESAGRVSEITVGVGETVTVGQTIGKIKTAQGTETPLISNFEGLVTDVLVEQGAVVAAQAQLLRLELTGKPLQALLLVPLADGKQLSPGMTVQLAPSTARVTENGYLLGKVSFVSQLPSTLDRVRNLLKSRELAQALLSGGPSLEVRVTLENPSGNPGQYKWSSGNGPILPLSNGTLCRAEVVLSEQSPLALVLPVFKAQKGS